MTGSNAAYILNFEKSFVNLSSFFILASWQRIVI